MTSFQNLQSHVSRVTLPFKSEAIMHLHSMAVIGVEPAVKYPFVLKGMQTRRKGQYNAELTLSPRLYVKPLITPITAISIGNPHTVWSSMWN